MPTSAMARQRARRARAPPRIANAVDFPPIIGRRSGTAVALVGCGMLLMNDDRFNPSPTVRASVSGDGLVLLDVDGGLVLSSNAVGARIWQLIEHGHTTGEIAQQLAGDYAVPLERAQHDVAVFVADLIARGLVGGDPRR